MSVTGVLTEHTQVVVVVILGPDRTGPGTGTGDGTGLPVSGLPRSLCGHSSSSTRQLTPVSGRAAMID